MGRRRRYRGALAEAKRPRPQGSGPEKRIEVYRERGVALFDHTRQDEARDSRLGAPLRPRGPSPEAKGVYRFAKLGTPVFVF